MHLLVDCGRLRLREAAVGGCGSCGRLRELRMGGAAGGVLSTAVSAVCVCGSANPYSHIS